MPSTSNYGLRYPSLTDAPNGPTALQNLAGDVDSTLVRTPALYAQAIPLSGGFSNTTLAGYTSAHFTVTPVQTGWAEVFVDLDMQTGGAGYYAAIVDVRVDTVDYEGAVVAMYESQGGHVFNRLRVAYPVLLTSGHARVFDLFVAASVGSGSWKILSGEWRIVQP